MTAAELARAKRVAAKRRETIAQIVRRTFDRAAQRLGFDIEDEAA